VFFFSIRPPVIQPAACRQSVSHPAKSPSPISQPDSIYHLSLSLSLCFYFFTCKGRKCSLVSFASLLLSFTARSSVPTSTRCTAAPFVVEGDWGLID
jgi:hypothetical protein